MWLGYGGTRGDDLAEDMRRETRALLTRVLFEEPPGSANP